MKKKRRLSFLYATIFFCSPKILPHHAFWGTNYEYWSPFYKGTWTTFKCDLRWKIGKHVVIVSSPGGVVCWYFVLSSHNKIHDTHVLSHLKSCFPITGIGKYVIWNQGCHTVRVVVEWIHYTTVRSVYVESLLVPLTIPGTKFKFSTSLHVQCAVNSPHNSTYTYSPVRYPCLKPDFVLGVGGGHSLKFLKILVVS